MKELFQPWVKGFVRLSRVYRGTWLDHGPWWHNDVLFEWATIAGTLLTQGLSNYRLSGIYLEFENAGGAPVTVPSFTRDEGIAYYNGLVASPDRDYLRVGLNFGKLTSSNETNFPGGNLMTFQAQTSGIVGVHGKTFSDTVSSRVYGGALVAQIDANDASQDLIFSRFYFPSANQKVKEAGSQIGATYQVELG